MTSPPAASRVARHTLLSLLGFIVPLGIALFAIPVAARALGPARFGLLGLAWATVEYLGLFDLGLSRSTVRFVADALARAARDLKQIVSVAVATQLGAASIAAVALWLLAPAAVGLFSVPPNLVGEAVAVLRAVAANVVAVLTINGLRGILEGAQRFDLSVALKIPAASAATLVPAVGAISGLDVPGILWWLFFVRVLIVLVLFGAAVRAIPGFRWELPREWRRLRRLLGYSGWLALSGGLSAVLVTFDRFVLAAVAGVVAVGFYSAAYEGAVRILLIPQSMFAALFPALTAVEAVADRNRSAQFARSALRQTALLLGFIVCFVVIFAPEILRLWVGAAFAAEAGLALRILAVGVFANALALVPTVFLYAAGRPDLPAKLHVLEVLIHVPVTLILVRRFGVTGAAIAWSVRVVLDAFLLGAVAQRLGAWSAGVSEKPLWSWGVVSLVTWLVILLLAGQMSRVAAAIAVVLGVGIAGIIAWSRALAPRERRTWLALIRLQTPSAAVSPP